MSSTTDKIKGYANQAAGNLKQSIGKLTGSESLEAEGVVQELKGEAQTAVGDIKEAANTAYERAIQSSTADDIRGHTNDAVGNAKQAAGRALSSEELEAEGIAQEITGEAQKVSAKIKKAAGN